MLTFCRISYAIQLQPFLKKLVRRISRQQNLKFCAISSNVLDQIGLNGVMLIELVLSGRKGNTGGTDSLSNFLNLGGNRSEIGALYVSSLLYALVPGRFVSSSFKWW